MIRAARKIRGGDMIRRIVFVPACAGFLFCCNLFGSNEAVSGSPTTVGFGQKVMNVVAEDKKEAQAAAVAEETKQLKMPEVPAAKVAAPAPVDPAMFKPVLSGYVRFDAFADTRQVLGIRGDIISLFPVPASFDANGNDILDAAQLHMVAIRTYMKWAMMGPPVLGAKTNAVVAADFSGPWCHDNILDVRPQLSMSTINGFALTDAYFTMDWQCASLLIGHYWHPLFDLRVSPGTLLLEPISRCPQVRWTRKVLCDCEVEVTASSQVDNLSSGPSILQEGQNPKITDFLRQSNASLLLPDAGMAFMKNSVIPDFTFQFRKFWGKHIFGIACDVKWLKPRLFTAALQGLANAKPVLKVDGTPLLGVAYWQPGVNPTPVIEEIIDPLSLVKTYATNERVRGVSLIAYAALNFDCTSFKAKFTYAENMSDQSMLGGYGVVSRDYNYTTQIGTGREEYAPFKTIAIIGEGNYTHCNKQFSLNAGYSKLLGLKGCRTLVVNPNRQNNNTRFDVYGLANNMKDICKVTPTVKFLYLPIVFAAGLEYARARFGDLTPEGKIVNAKAVHNWRSVFSAFYFF